ncbi:phosphotransferase [Symbiopectobacterium purcellii]|uniref:phosphotransferase n=1 Tax=Symbiopectobacterium purcellii TaxID=2871826 RepID=UPI003F87BA7A
MVPSNSKVALERLLAQHFPAVDTAGFHFDAVNGSGRGCWRVRVDDPQLLARPQTTGAAQLGVFRQREYRVLRQLSARQLAPKPVVYRDGWLIVEWASGATVSAQDFSCLLENGSLAQLLSQLHRQPCCGFRLNLPMQFTRHWQNMDPRRRSPALLRWHHHFQRKAPPDLLAWAPLHLDVHSENVLITPQGSLLLIDWEYAADGDIGLELALLVRGNGLDVESQRHLLRTYQQQRPGLCAQALNASVQQWLPWADYLILMWCEVCWHQTGQTAFLAAGSASRRALGLNV